MTKLALIEAKNVTKVYQSDSVATKALDNVNFTVNQGEFVAIMGASGSGKSTLLHIIGLLDHPSKGTYYLAGKNTANFSDVQLARTRNSKIGFVFQDFHLLPRTSVLENVMLPLQYSNSAQREHVARAKAALEKVDMLHRLSHSPGQLSGGEKQRTCIARALVTEPQVLLADEPTGNLDSKTGAKVMELIDSLHEKGLTVIVITHETLTAQYAQRILTLKDGQVITDKEVKKKHSHY